MKKATAHSTGTEDRWSVECPKCLKEYEYEGYFDAGDKYTCLNCETVFIANKLILPDGAMIL